MKKLFFVALFFTTLLFSSQNVFAEIKNDHSVSTNELVLPAKESPYCEVEIEEDFFTIYISDSEVIEELKKQGYNVELTSNNKRVKRSTGVTKIEGKLSSGNFKVYLSKNMLNTLEKVGPKALSFLLGGLAGFSASVIYDIISADSGFTHGRVFVFKNYLYHYWYYQ